MSICYIVFSDGIGGAEQVVKKISQSLNNKVAVSLIVNSEIYSYFSDIDTVSILDIGSLYQFKSSLLTKIFCKAEKVLGARKLLVRSKLIKIENFLEKNNTKVVHTHLMYDLYVSTLLSPKLNIKTVYTVHAFLNLDPQQKIQFVFNHKYFISLLNKVDLVTSVSPLINDYIKRNFSNISLLKDFIPNGVDFNQISNANSLNQYKILDKKLNVVYLGGEKKVKGADYLINELKIFSKLALKGKCRFTILGPISEGSEFMRELKKLSCNLDINIEGFVKAPGHLDHIMSADCMLVPSLSEGMPLVVMEAFALGVPVIGAKIPILEYLLHPDSIFSLEEEGLVSMLNDVIEEPAKLEVLLEYSVNKSVLDWGDVAESYEKIYLTI